MFLCSTPNKILIECKDWPTLVMALALIILVTILNVDFADISKRENLEIKLKQEGY